MQYLEQDHEGLFVAALYDYTTCQNLANYIKQHNIPNPVTPDSFHTTIVHSVIDCDFTENHNVDIIIEPENITIDVLNTAVGNVLVLRLRSEYLDDRYTAAIESGAAANYDAWNPHLTLSMDIGWWDHSFLPRIEFPLRIIGEYSKPLQW